MIKKKWKQFVKSVEENNVEECCKIWECQNQYYMKYFINKYRKFFNKKSKIQVKRINSKEGIIDIQWAKKKMIIVYDIKNDVAFKFKIQKKLEDYFIRYEERNIEGSRLFYKGEVSEYYIKSIKKESIRIKKFLKTPLENKIRIYFFDNKKEMEKVIESTEVDGFFDPLKNIVYLIKDEDSYYHELIHAVTYWWAGWPSNEIHEGIAESYKEIPFGYREAVIKDKLSFEHRLEHLELKDSLLLIEEYFRFGMMFKFIREKSGIETIKEIYELETFTNFERILEKILKIEPKIFIKELNKWSKEYLKRIEKNYELNKQ